MQYSRDLQPSPAALDCSDTVSTQELLWPSESLQPPTFTTFVSIFFLWHLVTRMSLHGLRALSERFRSFEASKQMALALHVSKALLEMMCTAVSVPMLVKLENGVASFCSPRFSLYFRVFTLAYLVSYVYEMSVRADSIRTELLLHHVSILVGIVRFLDYVGIVDHSYAMIFFVMGVFQSFDFFGDLGLVVRSLLRADSLLVRPMMLMVTVLDSSARLAQIPLLVRHLVKLESNTDRVTLIVLMVLLAPAQLYAPYVYYTLWKRAPRWEPRHANKQKLTIREDWVPIEEGEQIISDCSFTFNNRFRFQHVQLEQPTQLGQLAGL